MRIIFILIALFAQPAFCIPQSDGIQEGFINIPSGKLFYRAVGEGEPLFIVHGGPGLDHTYLLPGMDALASRFRLIYFDQRGTGRSTAELNCESINMDNFVEDLERLRKEFSYSKITLLGHSLGGLLAMEYAVKYPNNLKALIVLHSLPTSTKGLEHFYENVDSRLKPFADRLGEIEASDSFKLRKADAVGEHLHLILKTYFWDQSKSEQLNTELSEKTAANLHAVHGLIDNDYLTDFDIREKIGRISVPTLVIHGDFDPIPEKYAEEIHLAIKGSKYLLIGRCGHFPYVEQPYTLFKGINGFLDSINISL